MPSIPRTNHFAFFMTRFVTSLSGIFRICRHGTFIYRCGALDWMWLALRVRHCFVESLQPISLIPSLASKTLNSLSNIANTKNKKSRYRHWFTNWSRGRKSPWNRKKQKKVERCAVIHLKKTTARKDRKKLVYVRRAFPANWWLRKTVEQRKPTESCSNPTNVMYQCWQGNQRAGNLDDNDIPTNSSVVRGW